VIASQATGFFSTPKKPACWYVPLPDFVIEAINAFEPMNKTYYFWSGESSRDGVARTYMTRLNRVFKLAGIVNGHAHRFRDTFAVELLLQASRWSASRSCLDTAA
jgi:integrase